MSTLSNKIRNLFSSDEGKRAFSEIESFIRKNNMESYIDKGVLIGFSGGADSCFLLSFLYEYRQRYKLEFEILAVHVNHGIRGNEAKRDEEFSVNFANELFVSNEVRYVDVPSISAISGLGIEETARNERYSIFADIIKGRNDISTIAVAHNATDNMETVIFNILRGAGISGVCGIKPIRENIIRPMLTLPKSVIIALLDKYDIPYVTDSTNFDIEYDRNYIRNNIIPAFSRLSIDPEDSFTRMTSNLRNDLDYLNSESSRVLSGIKDKQCIDISDLREIHRALFARVVSNLVFENTSFYPTEKQINSIYNLINTDSFCISLSGEYNFVATQGKCYFVKKNSENPLKSIIFNLKPGENKISGTNLTVFLLSDEETFSNVYNFSIQVDIPSDIIDDGLFIRFRQDGDAYKYDGITHKLKKVFNDKNIPIFIRDFIPVLCDKYGILYVPGIKPADRVKCTASDKKLHVFFCFERASEDILELYTLSENHKNEERV